jgi:hypothetical protein
MSQPSSGQATAASYYDDMPFSLVLFRFLWPFWLLKDASNGDRLTRAAAYSHNRDMRIYLPGYLMRWMVSCVATLGMTTALGSMAGHGSGDFGILTVLAAGFGMAFACGVCVWVVTAYIYLFLSRYEN